MGDPLTPPCSQFCESEEWSDEEDFEYSLCICEPVSRVEIEGCYACILEHSSGDAKVYAQSLKEGMFLSQNPS